MPRITCVVGGFYGSEGKGKVCGYFANEYDVAVRVGAPNAGHTVKLGDNVWKMQQIPVAGLINPDIELCIGAAGLINLHILEREMAWTKGVHDRLFIDRNAGILLKEHREMEEAKKMFEGIGSTCEGCGEALMAKIARRGAITAKDVPVLAPYIMNVSSYLNIHKRGKKVMLEGTQGYKLSLDHGDYPFCTSRNIVASSLLSDVGLAPQTLEETILVIRTYPIRVAGNSGPMCGEEIDWETVRARAGIPTQLEEKTTVTKRVRRVCEFNMDLVKETCRVNRPTQIALMFVDYIDYTNYGVDDYNKLTSTAKRFVEDIEEAVNVPVTLVGTGPDFEHMCDRRTEK